MRQLRERVGLRTVDVASKLFLSEGTVRNWEKGRTIPTLTPEQMLELCTLYKATLEEIVQAVRESRQQAKA